jgi:hypothetical protein
MTEQVGNLLDRGTGIDERGSDGVADHVSAADSVCQPSDGGAANDDASNADWF